MTLQHSGFSNTQRASGMPIERYRAFPPIDLPDRTWPSAQITEAPRWPPTHLPDGHQDLIAPTSPQPPANRVRPLPHQSTRGDGARPRGLSGTGALAVGALTEGMGSGP